MPFKRHAPEGIIGKLPKAEIVLAQGSVQSLDITPGSLRENGTRVTFNFSPRDDLLGGEIFYSLAEGKSRSRYDGGITFQCVRTARWDIGLPRQKPFVGQCRPPVPLCATSGQVIMH